MNCILSPPPPHLLTSWRPCGHSCSVLCLLKELLLCGLSWWVLTCSLPLPRIMCATISLEYTEIMITVCGMSSWWMVDNSSTSPKPGWEEGRTGEMPLGQDSWSGLCRSKGSTEEFSSLEQFWVFSWYSWNCELTAIPYHCLCLGLQRHWEMFVLK